MTTVFDEETQLKAEKELRETDKIRKQSMKLFRSRIQSNNLLKCPTDDDVFLLKFLRRSKFNVEDAERLLINFYRLKNEHPKFCENIIPSAINIFLDQKVSCILPGRTKDNCSIYMLRAGNWDPNVTDLSYMYKMHVLNLEWLLANQQDVQVHGIHVLADLGLVGWNHMKNFSKEYAQLMTSLYQDAFPIRMKGFHFVSEPKIFSYLFSLIKPFMKSKLISRLVMHGPNMQSLHNYIPKSILPTHLGGDAGEWDDIYETHVNKLKENEEFFKTLASYRMHASIVLGESESITGTFKKIEVD